jgi:hypothetical protein
MAPDPGAVVPTAPVAPGSDIEPDPLMPGAVVEGWPIEPEPDVLAPAPPAPVALLPAA